MVSASGVILAGGMSRRLGADKALLALDGRPLVAHVLDVISGLAAEVLLVTRAGRRYESFGARVVQDLVPGAGSLGGIYTGLSLSCHPHSLVVACDMPFLSPALLRHMIGLSSGFDVVMPRVRGECEPLHAIYSRTCLAPIGEQLGRGDLRIIRFLDKVQVRYIDGEEIRLFDPEELSFFNVNSPDDVKRMQAIAKQRAVGRQAMQGGDRG